MDALGPVNSATSHEESAEVAAVVSATTKGTVDVDKEPCNFLWSRECEHLAIPYTVHQDS